MSSKDLVNDIVNKLFDEVLQAISMEWKGKTDVIIKGLKKQNKRLIKRNEHLSDALRLKTEESNQFIHASNIEKIEMNILIMKLQNKIMKLEEYKT